MNNEEPRGGHMRRTVILWAVVTVIVLLVYLIIAPQLESWGVLPTIASQRVGEIDQVLWLFTLLSIPVFTMVVVFAGYSVFTWRVRGRPDRDGTANRGNRGTQIVWTSVSIVLAAFLFGYGLYFLGEVDAAPSGNVLHVNVTAEQWLWQYTYPDYGNVSTTTLELPVNRPVEFNITSIDVQHSFWIPSMGIKEDAVPGETTHISMTPDKLGTYVVRCAELCGIYHSYMETPVRVVDDTTFSDWISQQTPAPSSSSFVPMSPVALTGIGDRRLVGV